jgi:transcriptional regulator with XRE-family HTH domain
MPKAAKRRTGPQGYRSPGALIREARAAAGLTQAELAERMGTTQSAVARLEGPGSNPRVESLERALLAAGHRLELRADPAPQPLDETLIAGNLERTPAERLEAMEQFQEQMDRLLKATKRSDG